MTAETHDSSPRTDSLLDRPLSLYAVALLVMSALVTSGCGDGQTAWLEDTDAIEQDAVALDVSRQALWEFQGSRPARAVGPSGSVVLPAKPKPGARPVCEDECLDDRDCPRGQECFFRLHCGGDRDSYGYRVCQPIETEDDDIFVDVFPQ